MSRTVHRGIRQCPCQDCRESPKSATAEQHRTINRVVASFDEKGRRLFVAYLASQSGRGAIEHLAWMSTRGLRHNRLAKEPPRSPPEIPGIRCKGMYRNRCSDELIAKMSTLLRSLREPHFSRGFRQVAPVALARCDRGDRSIGPAKRLM